jgi:hypothetical protein
MAIGCNAQENYYYYYYYAEFNAPYVSNSIAFRIADAGHLYE